MEDDATGDEHPTKKRRIPKACAACRRSKVRCDEERPCTRCKNSGTECMYFERPRDPNIDRFEKIESELERLNQRLDSASPYPQQHSPAASHSTEHRESNTEAFRSNQWLGYQSPSQAQSLRATTSPRVYPSSQLSSGRLLGNANFIVRETSTLDVVTNGDVAEVDARTWFQTFFEGCDRFVPVFDSIHDNYDSVRRRSSVLFDIIIIYGARAAHGALSRPCQKLYGLLRQHTSDLVLRLSLPTRSIGRVEDTQALLVIASYSDSGTVLCDIALCSAIEADLPSQLDSLFAMMIEKPQPRASIESNLFTSARVWYYLLVLDMILSLDGGKPPSISLRSSSRRVRALLNHPSRTALDLRLFAQVELNTVRSAAHASIGIAIGDPRSEDSINSVVRGAILDLDLWLSEWQGTVFSDPSLSPEHSVISLNLQIQRTWAILTLHLRALTATGIENMALMTEGQKDLALAAKTAAESHLQLMLTRLSSTSPSTPDSERPYIANFRYAMEFVWAKNAFCVLIVLRLGILLGDSLNHLIARLSEANEFLNELDKFGMGANISYTRILAKTVQKCEKAVKASLQYGSGQNSADSSDSDFQSFIPKEFMFEWDFPGLHLCYIPLDWQDLFLDFGTTA